MSNQQSGGFATGALSRNSLKSEKAFSKTRRSHRAALLSLLAGGLLPLSSQADVITANVAADTFILSSSVNNSAGGHTWIDAGRDNLGGVRRALLRFDLSGVPAGATITSAVVRLTIARVPFQPLASTVHLHKLNTSWGEGSQVGNSGGPANAGDATWNARMHGSANWTTPGANSDAAGTSSASVAVTDTQEDVISLSTAGLVADVQSWLAAPAQNHGWLLVSAQEDSGKSVRAFYSKEGGAGAPKLEVGYTVAQVNLPPVVNITNPQDGATLTGGPSFTVAASASDPDGTIAQVQFFDGNTSLGVDANSPFSISAQLARGGHSLTAVATDNSGAFSTSSVVNVTVGSIALTNPIASRIPKGDKVIELRPIADGMVSPITMAVPDDGSGRMFVMDQVGVVWLVTSAGRSPTPVLDLRTRLINIAGNYDERGLLGLAVHTNFAQNPYIYTYTSEPNGGPADFPTTLPVGATNNHQSVIAEWRMSTTSANQVDVSTRREIMRIDEPQSNHNGGAMHFGPDGLLYVSFGDGGNADDQGNGHSPGGNGQDTTNILGSIIRIDVHGNTSPNGQYSVPSDNPFVAQPGVDEIYAYGLRNPFSFSFDRQTGALYLSDVGQNRVEEINIIQKGGNYGWNIKEGTFFFDPNGNGAGFVTDEPVRSLPPSGVIDPIAEYDHDDGTSIIGGYIYRGTQLPELTGRYIFGDWGIFGSPSGRLFYLDSDNTIKEFQLGRDNRGLGYYLKGFGQDSAGELYVFGSKPQGPSGAGGTMFKIIPAPATLEVRPPALVNNNTNIQVTSTGGVSTVVQQRKARIDEPVWQNEMFCTTTPTLTVPARGNGFFRRSDTAQQRSVPFTAHLSGAYERPAVPGNGQGFGIFALQGDTLSFTITYSNLSGAPNNAHFHGPTVSTNNATVLIDLRAFHNGPFAGPSGSFSGAIVLTPLQKAHFMNGQVYVNIHTVANGGGEIRGQVAPVLYHASALGEYETGSVSSPASGFGSFILIGTQLTFSVTYKNLKSTATDGHIHGRAPLGQNASVMIGFTPFNGGAWSTSGTVNGTVALTTAQLQALVDGHTYVNFHTTNHSSGEIRGQILPQITALPLTAWISGQNERPTGLNNSAAGLAILSLEGDQLAFNIAYTGLSGPRIGAHIHGPAATTGNASVMIDLEQFATTPPAANGSFSGSVTLTPAQRAAVLAGQTYVNLHTTANQSGEARGNIGSVLMQAAATGTAERPAAISSSGWALGQFLLVGQQLSFNVVYNGLSGVANAAHIHAPATATQNASPVLDFMSYNGGAYGAFGVVSGSTVLTPSVLGNMIDGLGYVNFHTPTYGSGEIRGQIGR